MKRFLLRGVPATTWLMLIYAVVVYADRLFSSGTFLDMLLFEITMLSGATLLITGSWTFVVLAFAALAIETIRATRIRDSSGNDYLSVITLVVALVLLIAVDAFGTMAFAVLFLAALIDVLQDRVVGQAVARRDWGVQMPAQEP